ncbi:MAG: hypothetical protein KGH75_07490 [Rhodospirillales bacterium]|nr:hypothetical protein [Rhodospirillales bacterium]
MSNSLLTIDMITKDALPLFVNSNALLQKVNRQYASEFKDSGAKIGETVRIRLPSDYTVTNGPNLNIQSNVQVNSSLTVSSQKHVDIAFTSVEQRMQLSEFRELVLRPAINNLAGQVAADLASLADTVPNYVANTSGGSIIAPTKSQFLRANALLTANSAPVGERAAFLHPETNASMVDSQTVLYNPAGQISDIYKKGVMGGPALGIGEWYEDQTTWSHTSGSFSAGAVTGVGVNGTSLTVAAGTTGTLVAGDIITVAGVYAVNRVTKQTSTRLMQFVVTANVASGGTSIPIYPALVPPSGGNPVQFQTVNAAPAANAAITMVNPASTTFTKNLVMRPEAFTMATPDLPLYGAGIIAGARENYQGCSLRIIDAYLPGTDQKVTRIDVLYGYAAIRPEWAVCVADVPTYS